ncbi:MAG: hypothetical protein HYS77_05220 [Candidatus Rokubacteria bacterium]|nr:hypothetical protein [Candidatus Rokubacteria bacterium]
MTVATRPAPTLRALRRRKLAAVSGPPQAFQTPSPAVRGVDYLAALARIPQLNASFTELFEQRYDAIVTPAAFGTAPAGLASTGDPACCALWTLCGMPALSVPLMQGANGLPLGVQLVGPRDGDGRLLRTARWLERACGAGVESPRRTNPPNPLPCSPREEGW